MIYLMSDIHGCCQTFKNMLKQIGFGDTDTLYILGDVIDRGAQGIEILQFAMAKDNIIMLMGNHEYLMLDMLRHDGEWHKQPIELWTKGNGGESTYQAMVGLPKKEQDAILDFIEALPYELRIEIAGRQYNLVHGRPNLTEEERENKYHDEFYAYYEGHFENVWGHFLPYTIKRKKPYIFAHTITSRYSNIFPGEILYRNGNIGIDCGCAFQDYRGRLGCLRLDDLAEFYEEIDPADISDDAPYHESPENAPLSEGDFEYEIMEDDTVKITNFLGDKKRLGKYDLDMILSGADIPSEFQTDPSVKVEVKIPSMIAEVPVTTLDNRRYDFGAFAGLLSVTDIILPDSLVYIGSDSFKGCLNLQHAALPNGLKTIKRDAFKFCKSLSAVEIPESVISIGAAAFAGCEKLDNITIPGSTSHIGVNAFSGTKWFSGLQNKDPLVVVNRILIDGRKATGRVVIPDGVTAIGDNAFLGNKELVEVVIPDDLIAIGDNAFSYCDNLAKVAFSRNIGCIGDRAFYGTKWFETELSANNDILIINGILVAARKLPEMVDIPAGVTQINSDAFDSYTAVKWLRIPEGVTKLDHYVFAKICGWTHAILPDSLSDTGGKVLEFNDLVQYFVSENSPLRESLKAAYGTHRSDVVVTIEASKAKEFAKMPLQEAAAELQQIAAKMETDR